MEEKKLGELSDEMLDKVTGGADDGNSGFVPCPNCHEHTLPKPGLGSHNVSCCKCGAIVAFQDGEVHSFTVCWKPTDPTASAAPKCAGDTIYEFDQYETPL